MAKFLSEIGPADARDAYRYGYSDGMAGEERAFLPFGETGCHYTAGYDAALTVKIKAKYRLQPDKPQKPCDHGLFSDDSQQEDMFSRLP